MKNTRLKDARDKCNLTQEEVAARIKTTVRGYQYYEAGKRNPSVKTAIRIARALRSTVEELFE